MISVSQHPALDDLRTISVFADLGPTELEWLAVHFSNEVFESGETLISSGTPATYMIAVFEGEIQARRESITGDALYLASAGVVTGKLPFSRMKEFSVNVRAAGRTRIGRMEDVHFAEMLQRIPEMGERLVGVLSDRVREVARIDQNREKMAALGKLSAGLAHELNNPASAISRATANLREAQKQLAEANRKLETCSLNEQQREKLEHFETEAAKQMDSAPVLDTLALSDREQELIDWMEDHGIKNAWEYAPVLAETGMDPPCLDHVLSLLGERVLGTVIRRVVATFNVERLLREIENSADRISILVRAVKEYSYMDRMQEQEIDLHRGIDNTLTMLGHRLKHGVNVHRIYDPAIPKVMANGGELNQIWTNLITNAIDAMKGKGELQIRTAVDGGYALVEVIDNGPGVPEEIQSRIFEPFFTTKDVGEGTGLGLDFVYRIVKRHHGDIRLRSNPGETSFQVRLPFTQTRPQQK